MASRFISLNLAVLLCGLLIMVSSCVEEPFLHPEAAESGNAFFMMFDQPTVLDQNLEVRAVASNLVTPISIVFLSANSHQSEPFNLNRPFIVIQGNLANSKRPIQLTNRQRFLNTGKTKIHIYC